MRDNLDTKKQTITFLLFTAIIVVMTLILVGFIFLAKSSWNNRLAVNVYEVLQNSNAEFSQNNLRVGNPVKINSTAAVSSNVYEIIDDNDNVVNYALITRVSTYYGPQAGVFLFNQGSTITFEGFACLNSRVTNQLENRETDIILKHWNKNAEKIFAASEIEKEIKDE